MHPCRQLRPFLPVTLVAILLLAGCGGGGSPIAPWTGPVPTAPSPPTSGPRLLLAGQSNAAYLQIYLFQPVTVISGGSIDYWLQSVEFADKARSPDLEAFVWWQGLGDAGRTTVDDYARKLRDLIAIARTTHPGLPVRIVEISYQTVRDRIYRSIER